MAERRLLYTVHTHFGNVRLFKEQELGHGSFATVCRAQCDDLPCAAKVLHADFFDQDNPDPGEGNFISKFIKECNILPSITHPNIVQCFGTYEDPETDLPVLLMELMDESLTNYLEHSQDHLPFHTEVSFSYDVALGLSYLHSRGYVHRDLSSNNVLIMAGVRAKITDFGMCRAVSGPSFRQTRQTRCPGTHPYMPPEALVDPPKYTDKLDVFSFGILMIQIMTRKFPEPGPAHRALRTMLHQAIPEDERREKHIKLVSQGHQMLPLAKQCIQNSPDVRSTSHDICNSLRVLKESCDFQKSKDADSFQRKLEKLSLLNEFYLQRLQTAHKEEISRITTNHSQQIEDIHHHYQEQLPQNTQKQATQCTPSRYRPDNHRTSNTGDVPPAPKSGFDPMNLPEPAFDLPDAKNGSIPFDPMNLPEPAFDTHDLNKMLHQEARTPEDLYASGILSMPAFDSPASKGVSIPFDPLNLPEPAFDTHDLNKMLHQEASVPEHSYTSGMLSMIIDPHSADYDFSGPNLDDHLTLRSHDSGHMGLIGGDTFSDSQLQPPSTDAHQTEQPFVPQPRPRSFSGGPLSISERPPLPRPRSNQNLISTQHLQTPPPSPGRKKPVAKPRTTVPKVEKSKESVVTPVTTQEDISIEITSTNTSLLSDKLQEKLTTIDEGAVTSHLTSMDSNSSMPMFESEHDSNHFEATSSLESCSPHPSVEASASTSSKSDPCPSTSPHNASQKVFMESSITSSVGTSWVNIDVTTKEQQHEICSSLDSQPRPRDRPVAFLNTVKSEKSVKPLAESTGVSKTSKTSLSDSLFEEDYMYNQVSDELHNAQPCWYCTYRTMNRVCEICGNNRFQNKETTL